MLKVTFGAAEANASRRGDVEEIGLHVPGVGIHLKGDGSFLEDKGPVFIGHSEETRAARSSIEPEHDWIVIGISLRVEEDIVEGGSIEVEHA